MWPLSTAWGSWLLHPGLPSRGPDSPYRVGSQGDGDTEAVMKAELSRPLVTCDGAPSSALHQCDRLGLDAGSRLGATGNRLSHKHPLALHQELLIGVQCHTHTQ